MGTFSIDERLRVTTTIRDNPYEFEEKQLFDLALRINKKRQFLFVSKVLGKHLHVKPFVPLYTGFLLACRFLETQYGQMHPAAKQLVAGLKANEPTVSLAEQRMAAPEKIAVIGFAETATALGHAFFNAFSANATYIHTTREKIQERASSIAFEEEHSHATSHRLYAPEGFFDEAAQIVLVDDEMSTGKTNLNIIAELAAYYPHIKRYTVVSILDWRNEAERAAYETFANEHHITLNVVTLMAGEMAVEGAFYDEEVVPEAPVYDVKEATISEKAFVEVLPLTSQSEDGSVCTKGYAYETGRFGLTAEENVQFLAQLAKRSLPKRGKTLVVGTGECMFLPMMLGLNLGEDVYTQSTTRSPIFVDEQSVIYEKYRFGSLENAGVPNFLYSVSKGNFEQIIIVVERIADQQGLDMLIAQLSVPVLVVELTRGVLQYDGQHIYENEL